jgi:anti-sigma-K factor RskA
MSGIDTLPVEERAVLQLLLQQGRPYADLSELLDIDPAEVRRRAHSALDALGPDETGLDAGRRGEIGDYLLGQQDEAERTATHGFLEGSAAGRAWARVVAGELSGVAGDRLPPIPADGRNDGAPVVPARPAPTAAAEPAGAAAASEAAATAPAPAAAAVDDTPRDGRLGAPRSSRLGGAILLGGLAVVVIAAALFFLVFNKDDNDSATPAASTTATQPQAQVEAQVNLVPPDSRKNLKALGVVLVQRAQGQEQIVAAVQGLPKPKKGGYGIWLYSGPGKAKWLGFFASQDSQGRLLARGQLTTPLAGYREILVTREARGNPPRPGPIYLRGPIEAPSSSGSSSTTGGG